MQTQCRYGHLSKVVFHSKMGELTVQKYSNRFFYILLFIIYFHIFKSQHNLCLFSSFILIYTEQYRTKNLPLKIDQKDSATSRRVV